MTMFLFMRLTGRLFGVGGMAMRICVSRGFVIIKVAVVVRRKLAINKSGVCVEGLVHQPVHVECGHKRCTQPYYVEHHPAAPGRCRGAAEDLVLAEEAR